MTRERAVLLARNAYDSGAFFDALSRRIAIPTESPDPARGPAMRRYLVEEMGEAFGAMGFRWRLLENSQAAAPFLLAERNEDPAAPTVFGYGHGDVVPGLDADWRPGLSPWQLVERAGRWYGRGIADNKGQHSINLQAMQAVIAARGRLGFNAKYLIEMGEETGSAGLREVCTEHREAMRADVMVASDGPRLRADRPTVFLGSRGCIGFDLSIQAREGGYHSGNWGGLLSNPGIRLAHAIASITSATGKILVPQWLPPDVPPSVRRALADCALDTGPNGPEIQDWWGEPGLRPMERLVGWSSFEVLAFEAGNPRTPVNAIPPTAWARCGLRFTVGVDPAQILPALRAHLDAAGFADVQLEQTDEGVSQATRLDPEEPGVQWVIDSIARSCGKKPALLPNLGGSLPNDIFTDVLGLRTIWIPHSYAGCSQHAANEHLPTALVREALEIMAGLYWDLGAGQTPFHPNTVTAPACPLAA